MHVNMNNDAGQCCRYLEDLVDYLAGYLERIQPLLDQSMLVEDVKKEFDEKWSAGQFPGWRVSVVCFVLFIMIVAKFGYGSDCSPYAH